MRDLTLHALTNRANDFVSPVFPRNSDFKPVPETAAVAAVRRLLGLDVRTNDYYVIGMLRAVEACPDILESLGGRIGTRLDYVRPADVFTGFSLLPSPQGAPFLRCRPTGFPVPFSLSFDYLAPGVLRLTWGQAAWNLTVRPHNELLYVDWPKDLAIGGLMSLTQPWQAGFHGEIQHIPSSYPYKAVADMLAANTDTVELLRDTRLVQNFFSAQDAIEKVALVGLALGKRTL